MMVMAMVFLKALLFERDGKLWSVGCRFRVRDGIQGMLRWRLMLTV